MNIVRWGMTALAAVVFGAGFTYADDSASLRSELADLKAKVAAMESTQQDGGCNSCGSCGTTGGNCTACGAECLTSMKGNGNIKIGGSVHVDLLFIHGESNETTNINGDDDDYRRTVFGAGSDAVSDASTLDFKINAADNMYFMITLELNNDENGSGDILENLYFAWEGVKGSNWDLYVGEKAIDYGMNKSVGIMKSFHDGGAYLISEGYGGPAGTVNGTGNRSGAIGVQGSTAFATQGTWSTSSTERYQIELVYHYCDLANFYFTLFQNSAGVFEDRSNDNLGFESWAVKAEVMPLEGLTVQASLENWHNESVTKTNARTEDSLNLSVGFDYDFQCLPLNVWSEYQHGFDSTFANQTDIDIWSIGATYGFSECLSGTLMFDWANVDDPLQSGVNNLTNVIDEDYYQIVVNGTYTFDNGVYFMAEYAYQWFDADRTGAGDLDSNASMIGFRVGLDF